MSIWKRKRGKRKGNDDVHVVNNLNAGRHTSHAGIGYVIGQILSQPLNPHRIYDTATLADLETASKKIANDRPGLVVIVGGDGTVHQTLTSILTKYREGIDEMPDILIIPTGTMNLVATAVGCNRIVLPPKALAQRVADKLKSNQPFFYVKVRTLKVNDQYGFMYGAGIPVDILENYYRSPELRGGLHAVRSITRSLWLEVMSKIGFLKDKEGLFSPIQASIRLEGHELPYASYMTHTAIMASTVDQVGFGCRAMPDAWDYGVRDQRFLIRSSRLTYLQMLATVGQLWAGLPLPETFDAPVSKAVIEYKQPTVRMVDGDLKKDGDQDIIETGPLLRLIVG